MGKGRPPPTKLTAKQENFLCLFLENGRNAADAYRVAYNSRMTPIRVGTEASRLLKHPIIARKLDVINRAREEAIHGVSAQYVISKEHIMAEMAMLSFSNMADYMVVGPDGQPHLDWRNLTREQAAALVEVTVEEFVKPDPDGPDEDGKPRFLPVRKVKFKLADKGKALMDLAKLGGFVIEKQEVTHIDAAQAERIAGVRQQLFRLLSDMATPGKVIDQGGEDA